MKLYLLLFTYALHAATGPKCVEGAISRLLKAGETPATALTEDYFKGIGRSTFETCFILKKGDEVDVFDEKFLRGVQMLKIRAPMNDIYMYFPRNDLAYMTSSRMQVKDNYFKHFHKLQFKSCFTIRKGQAYKITGIHRIGGQILIEIQDDKSGLFQWIPTKLLSVRDPRVTAACAK
jgi:hypothetical protein